ncbi:MAG: hypothetical protein H7257_13635 [Taibaiella sp.]|nr:hypothetical protein [Taibaiella sp.]
MPLYSKKLHSANELQREKLEIEKRLLLLEREDAFSSLDFLTTKKGKKSGRKEVTAMGSLLDLIPVSNPIMEAALKLVQRKFFSRQPDTERRGGEHQPSPVMSKVKKTAKGIVLDIVVSYLKWKAIELSYKGIAYLMKKRKEEQQMLALERPVTVRK